MKCVDCQDVLAEYALDSLEAREAARVAEHLSGGCAECQEYLDGVRAAWATLADSLQSAPPPPNLKADLLARLRAGSELSRVRPQPILSPEPEPVTLSSREGQSIDRAWRWQSMLPYVAATLFGIALGFWFTNAATTDSKLIDQYHAQLLEAERTFAAPQMRFAALRTSENRPDVRGYLIWDNLAEELHVFAFDQGAPADGSVYRLWFVADEQKWIPVGDLTVGSDGIFSAVIAAPKMDQPPSRVVVTTEPITSANAANETHGPIGLTGEFF